MPLVCKVSINLDSVLSDLGKEDEHLGCRDALHVMHRELFTGYRDDSSIRLQDNTVLGFFTAAENAYGAYLV